MTIRVKEAQVIEKNMDLSCYIRLEAMINKLSGLKRYLDIKGTFTPRRITNEI